MSRDDFLGCWPFLSIFDIEFHWLSFGERLEAFGLYFAKMDKDLMFLSSTFFNARA